MTVLYKIVSILEKTGVEMDVIAEVEIVSNITTDRISESGNAIASVRRFVFPSVPLF